MYTSNSEPWWQTLGEKYGNYAKITDQPVIVDCCYSMNDNDNKSISHIDGLESKPAICLFWIYILFS